GTESDGLSGGRERGGSVVVFSQRVIAALLASHEMDLILRPQGSQNDIVTSTRVEHNAVFRGQPGDVERVIISGATQRDRVCRQTRASETAYDLECVIAALGVNDDFLDRVQLGNDGTVLHDDDIGISLGGCEVQVYGALATHYIEGFRHGVITFETNRIGTGATYHDVVASSRLPNQQVVVQAAVENVVAGASVERVVPCMAVKRIGPCVA